MESTNLVLIGLFLHILGVAALGTPQEPTCKAEPNATVTCNFIPKTIPNGIRNVVLNLELSNKTVLYNSTFISSSWGKIKCLDIRADSGNNKKLYLTDNCFSGLNALQVLNIHVKFKLFMFSNTFHGLDKVTTLNMSGSDKLIMNDLTSALNGSDKLKRLTKLVLSYCSSSEDAIVVDDKYVQVLQLMNISYLDISGLQVDEVNLTAIFRRLKYLKVMNISSISVSNFIYSSKIQQADIKHIKTFDMSYATLPKKAISLPPGKFILSHVRVIFSNIRGYDVFRLLLTPNSVNFSGLVPHRSSIWIKNCTVTLDENPQYLSKELVIRNNNLRRLDIILICDRFHFLSFERLDISQNQLEFLHPYFLYCMPNLKEIDLSSNQLIKMAQESSNVFEIIFSRLSLLKNIKLSSNDLITIPMEMFRSNSEIEVIDLSSNKLDQIHFTLTELRMLKEINLQGNNIHILDTLSIDNLKSIQHKNVTVHYKVTVILKSNPLSCSKCETQPFISWLLSTTLCNITAQSLVCSNEKSVSEHVTEHTRDEVKKICERQTIYMIAGISAGFVVLFSTVVFLTVYIKRKHKSKLQNREKVINLLRKGEGTYEFAVFLAYNNDDGDFVNTYILHSLNEYLQQITGIDRELVCTGDRHFRPGFYVHNETFMRLNTASVMIVVASDNFCQSPYCRNELDQAYVNRKPIVLMFIEHIDPEVMIPTMKELYQKNVRILWSEENGEYKMKTTWDNVCWSILDLIH